MQSRVRKWGNSIALRIPKIIVNEVGLTENSLVEMSIRDGQIVIKPVQTPQYRLDDLLAQITDDNLHGEIDTGIAVGREII
jgi:antitoxin MazE